ncbi:tripartite tricarboxylate transporter substrate binding protein [Ramlibacter sp. AW1]|uniref:Tripartite tricarboxylate transporter substrate binding protein n=1 Tax=Ramlibacter aurantiacus TaxID=2801330 RepID=A0A936ZRZ3_9BURK|nr:tripartite tricarboxylate transporter substrate binding protein [Ramlibacter aurantiacus]MBL0421466.1 tripartite tricarboxylate transporter substrate binding protein [Ramlibacter aurantiacus]
MQWKLALAFAAAVLQPPAQAQAGASGWPERPVRIVVPAPAGSPSDLIARLVLEHARPRFGQPLIVENKPGAGGSLGNAELARAGGDGYTWMFGPDTVYTVNPHIYRNPNAKADHVVPVLVATRFNQTLVCHPALGVKTLPQLLQMARLRKLDYASGGAGTPGHLASEMLWSAAGVEMQHIPFSGPAPATQAVLAGTVPCGFLAGPTVLPHVREGRLVALAVSGTARSPSLPDVPTVAEAGVAGYAADFSMVLYAPRGTPQPIVQSFTTTMAAALQTPQVRESLKRTDQEVVALPPREAGDLMADISAKWGALARKINLQID